MLESRSQLLRAAAHCPLLRALKAAEVAELADLAEAREVSAGTELMTQGEEADYFAIVVAGSLKAAIPRDERWSRRRGEQPEAPLQEWRLMATGAVVGEMALFSGLRRTACVEALTDCTLAIIYFADVNRCEPALSARVRTGLANIGMSRLSSNLGEQAPQPPSPDRSSVGAASAAEESASEADFGNEDRASNRRSGYESATSVTSDGPTVGDADPATATVVVAAELGAVSLNPGGGGGRFLRLLQDLANAAPTPAEGEGAEDAGGALLRGAEPSLVRGLASLLHDRAFDRGELLTRTGDASSFVGIICEGSAAIQGEADALPIGPGGVFGLAEFFTGARRAVDVVAERSGVAACISFRALAAAFNNVGGQCSEEEARAARFLVARLALEHTAHSRAWEESGGVLGALGRLRWSSLLGGPTGADRPDQQQQAVLTLTAQLRQRQWENATTLELEPFLAERGSQRASSDAAASSSDVERPNASARRPSSDEPPAGPPVSFRFGRNANRREVRVMGSTGASAGPSSSSAGTSKERRGLSLSGHFPRRNRGAAASLALDETFEGERPPSRSDDSPASSAASISLPVGVAAAEGAGSPTGRPPPPLGSLSIQICSWNVNGKPANDQDLSSWLALDSDRPPPDIVCVGVQEFTELNAKQLLPQQAKKQEFERAIMNMLGHMHAPVTYVPVHPSHGREQPQQMFGLLMLVFIRSDEALRVQGAGSVLVPTGLGGLSGNKGGIAFRLTVAGFPLLLVNLHLPSGHSTSDSKERTAAFREVLRGAAQAFAPEELPAPLDRHSTFCFGDLNYRLTLPNREVRWRMQCRDWRTLLAADQLSLQLGEPSGVYEAWDEADIGFRPTYKYDPGSNTFDSSEKQRAPAWCDRVLWRTGVLTIVPELYVSCQNVVTSDHKPIKFLGRIKLEQDSFER